MPGNPHTGMACSGSLPAIAILAALVGVVALAADAADHAVGMLNKSADGIMVVE